jgi:NAD(P)-dependent dehydrogenase (short-subunit alcohol dehydrogenase family)
MDRLRSVRALRPEDSGPLTAAMLLPELPSGGKMNDAPILNGKRSVIFGAGGSIGAAVARAFGAEGAELFLAGRSKSSLEAIAREINEAGGRAYVAVVDVLDDPSVDKYLDEVVEQAGGIDVEFNATGPRAAEYGTGTPAVDLPVEQFLVGQTVLTGQFITARCAARRMVAQGRGVIIFLTGSPARPHSPGTVAIGAANGGIENVTRSMALELAGTGVRVVCLRTAANPDSRTIQDVAAAIAARSNATTDAVFASLADATFLKVSPHTKDTANAAVLLASDRARMMTGTVHNATAGATPD